ncbi:MAG: metallophosphoesterase [Segetibacter sp.]|nr:metallophosphoesterase [Segetibacter sp.]
MRNRSGWWVIVVIMFLFDFYVFQVIKSLASGISERARISIYIAYWTISLLAIAFMLVMPYINFEAWPKNVRTYLFATIIGLFFAKLIAVVFFLLDDIRRITMWIMGKVFPAFGPKFIDDEGSLIGRSAFLSWMGIGIGTTLFGTLLYGFSNKYNYTVKRVRLKYPNLPAAFKGFKIVHISDIHSGSFDNKKAVQKGVDTILKQKPDVILFTGDLVNDRATEMEDYMDVFSELKAPLGVYSTLGNHDYGDYVAWESPAAKVVNLQNLMKVHARLGWRLLMNEHVALEKNGSQIGLMGIENWSAKGRFPKHGRMDKAYRGADQFPFKILMSHDPSHWDAQVRPEYADIDLTLSGHTHGMQFGLETPFLKWSPVQWMYKQWAGLYEEGKQKLYINRGFGFIGYPGRVGILPEITVIELDT